MSSTHEHQCLTIYGAQKHIVVMDTGRCAYIKAGSGPSLVLLSGLGTSSETWSLNIGPLSERFTVLAPDLVGHGQTQGAQLRGSIDHMVNAVAAMFGQEEVWPTCWPTHVRPTQTAGEALRTPRVQVAVRRGQPLPENGASLESGPTDEQDGPPCRRPRSGTPQAPRRGLPPASHGRANGARFGMRGEQDRLFSVDGLHALRQVDPNIRMQVFINVGHWPYAEVPDDFDERLIEFLA